MPESGAPETESSDSVREKVRFILESVADMKDRLKELEKRTRALETEEMEQLRRSIYELETHVSNFRTVNEDHKERWKMAFNFLIQLVWVIMASYVLTKLGLGTGPL